MPSVWSLAALADLKADRDHWRDMAQASQRQLTDQRKPREPFGWWAWLRSTG